MKNVKLLNALLWSLNIAIGASISVFAFNYLLFPKDLGLRKDIIIDNEPIKATASHKINYDLVKNLSFPLKKQEGGGTSNTGPSPFPPGTELTGTAASNNPKDGVAFLTLGNRQCVADSEKIETNDGQPLAEMRGWHVKEVYSNRAVFANSAGQTVSLRIKEPTASATGTPTIIDPTGKRKVEGDSNFEPDKFNSKLRTKTEAYESWEIDPAEIQWVMDHFDACMQKDFDLSVYAQGGITVNTVKTGTAAAMRGIQSGDIIKSANGVELKDLTQLADLQNNRNIKNARNLVLVVERQGRTVRFEYAPAPGTPAKQ